MFSMRKCLTSAGVALLIAASPASMAALSSTAAASEIKVIVNRMPITSYDIQRRAAFLKLQRHKGNANAEAEKQMIDQTLRLAEAQRLGIRISDDQVDAAYRNFAKGYNMPVQQLDAIMNQSGVTKSHFKEFIRAQMSWGQALGRRGRSGALTEQEVVRRMLQQGGAKPTSTEYMLQQVIFVVPASERGKLLAQRKREAESLRARFQGCNRTREFAKGLIDVTVKDIGRRIAQELPEDWADQIRNTKTGGTTPVRETSMGVEFIGVCSSREVSDDRVARLTFQAEGDTGGDKSSDEASKKYTDELREKATIVKR